MPKRRKVIHMIETNVGLTDSFDSKVLAHQFFDCMVRDWQAGAGHSVKRGFIWTSLYHNEICVMKVRVRKRYQ